MSQKLVARSPDLSRLRNEGYDLEVVGGSHLLVKQIPYVNQAKEVARGTLVSVLTLQQDRTIKPADHVAYFMGNLPCDANGSPLTRIIAGEGRQQLTQGVQIDFTFSSRPTHGQGYSDYYEKLTTYAKILAHEAQAIDPTVTPMVFPVIGPDEDDPIFKYQDSSASRSGIDALSPKLAQSNVAILGLGGTGSYILDLIAKTRILHIHLFDDDYFLQHDAFRCPGAVGFDELGRKIRKVEYYQELYSKLRHGIIAHPYRIDESNLDNLQGMDFVFVCLDSGELKGAIFAFLEDHSIPFIDVGMGVHKQDEALHGILRVTTSTPQKRTHIRDNNRVSFAPAAGANEYNRNIQVADLNALNAALAVMKWKKHCGFYHDLECEHHSTYVIGTGKLSREDQ